MNSKYETTQDRTEHCDRELGSAKDFRFSRQGDLDLEFAGWLVGESEESIREDRSTMGVTLYYTTNNFIVARIVRHLPSNRGPDHSHVVKSKAQAFSSWRDMIAWLKEDGRGWLGENSKVAWEEMCSCLPWLHGEDTLKV
jgi:hypothetical protein